MTTEALSASARWSSVVAIWVVAAIAAVCIGVFSTPAQYSEWLALALGGCTVVSFAVQLGTRQKSGFVGRLASSLVGALLVLAIASAVLWLAVATK